MKSGALARLWLCAAIGAMPGAAWAADDMIVVTAARTAPLAALGGVALDRDDLARLAAPTALDALGRVAGVRAFAKGGGGSFLSVRGGEPNFTLVLLEGIKLNDPTNSAGGAFDFAQIDPDLVERIEVFRGAGSAVHGSDALSGVVNVRLREPAAGEASARTRMAASSRGEVGGSATIGLGWQGGGLLVGGGGYDGGDLDPGGKLARAQVLARGVTRLGGVRVAATGLHAQTDRRGFPEDGGGPRLSVSQTLETRATQFTLAGIEATAAAPARWRPSLRASWSRQRADADTPAIAPGVLAGVPAIRAASVFERFEAVGELRWQGGIADIAAGAAWLDERGRGRGSVDFGVLIPADFAIGRQAASGFVEATITPARALGVTFGVRHDAPTASASTTTARAAMSVAPWAAGPTFRASYAEGYKLPSLYALAYPLIANPTLRPERGRSFEVALEQAWRGGRARLAAFSTRYADLIDFDADSFTNVNRARVKTRGVEAEAVADVAERVTLTASASLLDVANDGGPPLRARPDWQAAATIEWRASEAVELFASGQGVGPSFDLSVPTGPIAVNGHATADIGATWRAMPGLSVGLVARNLGGARFEEAVGFRDPGRVVRLTVSASR